MSAQRSAPPEVNASACSAATRSTTAYALVSETHVAGAPRETRPDFDYLRPSPAGLNSVR